MATIDNATAQDSVASINGSGDESNLTGSAAASVPIPNSVANEEGADAASVPPPPPPPPSGPVAAQSVAADEAPILTEPQAIIKALDTGQAQSWISGGRAGQVRVQDREPQGGQPCRAYYVIDASEQSSESIVCRGLDGRWTRDDD